MTLKIKIQMNILHKIPMSYTMHTLGTISYFIINYIINYIKIIKNMVFLSCVKSSEHKT